MKRVLVLIVVLIFTFTMSGCDRTDDSASIEESNGECVVEEVVENIPEEVEETHEHEIEEVEEGLEEDSAYESQDVEGLGGLPVLPSFLWVDDATLEGMYDFNVLHEFDYFQIDGFESERGIVIWADVLMADFSIITLTHDFVDEGWYIFVEESWSVADEIWVGDALVIHGYHGSGTLPVSGFSFVDEDGETRYFAFIENMGYPTEPGPYRWIMFEFDGSTGRLIARMFS